MTLDLKSVLTDSQKIINNLPIDKSYVIEGGPGTGKTLLALLRAKKILESGVSEYGGKKPRVLFVVFNRPLNIYLRKQMQESGLIGGAVSTYHSWLWKLFTSRGFEKGYPNIRPYMPDWQKVKQHVLDWHLNTDLGYDHIILDESQDLPLELIDLLNSISTNITIFIDEEQNIDRKVATKVSDVVNLVCDSSRCKFFLTDNHRNYKEIIDLSVKFGADENIPNKSLKGGGRLPLLKIGQSEDEYISEISTYRQENPDQILGVLLVNNDVRDRYHDRLVALNEHVEKYISKEEAYRKSTQNKFSLDTNGIKLLSLDVAKGLEFHAVFIPTIDDGFWMDTKQKRNLAMVSVTRAEERLFMHAKSDSNASSSIFLRTVLDNESLVDIERTSLSNTPANDGPQFETDIPF